MNQALELSGSSTGRLPGRSRPRPPLVWILPALATVAVVNLPLVYIFLRAAEGGAAAWLETLWTPQMAALLGRTLLLAAAVVAAAVAIAVPAAWLVARTDLPVRRLWAVLAALPLVFPSYVAALALIAALGRGGYLESWLGAAAPAMASGFWGALLALALFTYPYVYLPLVAALRQLDPALEDSARGLGAGRWRTFGTVVLPQLLPALGAGALLVALYALSDFGGVSLMRYNTFTLAIYYAYGTLYELQTAAVYASVLVLLTLGVIAAEALLVRRLRPHRRRPARPPERVALGRWRWPALAFLALLALVNLGLPVGVIGFWGLRGLFAGGGETGALLAAAGGSLQVSLVAALAAAALSIPIAVWAVRHPGWPSRLAERLSYAGYALPGLVIALALVFFTRRYAFALYQTLPLLALAYVVRFLPEATANTRSALAAVAPVFEEAARGLGRRPLEVLRTLTLPLILPGLLAGGGLVFLTAMKELPATLLLRPTGFETLATEIWYHAADAAYGAAALPALALLVVTAPPLYLLVIRPVLRNRDPEGT